MRSTKRSVFVFVTSMLATFVLLQATPAAANYRREPIRSTCLDATNCNAPQDIGFIDDAYFDHTSVTGIGVDTYFPSACSGSPCNAMLFEPCAESYSSANLSCNSGYEIGPTTRATSRSLLKLEWRRTSNYAAFFEASTDAGLMSWS